MDEQTFGLVHRQGRGNDACLRSTQRAWQRTRWFFVPLLLLVLTEASPIGQALRKYLKENKKDGELTVIVAQNREDDRARGGVWAWPKAEIEAVSARVSNPGVATAAKRRAAKKS
jgi:hypothetical protein